MSNSRQTILASRPAAMVLALSLVAGLSTPFLLLPRVQAAQVIPNGTMELSAAPVNHVTAVPPNIAITFDDSGSMASDYMGDDRPFDGKGWATPWRCAGVINPSAASGIGTHVMNGVYYNPNVPYTPPIKADGTSFPNADATLQSVWDDGVTANRPLNPSGSGNTTDFTGTRYKNKWGSWVDNRWGCHGTSPLDNNGGPYYYQLKATALASLQSNLDAYGNPTSAGMSIINTASNWEAVAVPASQYQNWANWWAYYHTRNLMTRTAISRAFGSPSLAAKTADGGFGSSIRVAWQNLYTSDTFRLQANTIISALMDAKGCDASNNTTSNPTVALQSGTSTTAPPGCYRSAFFNWIFSVDATGNTPSRAATIRAGQFFTRGNGNNGTNGDLHDPYWQPPQTGAFDASSNPGNELYCRQNFHMLITDGYSNESDPSLPSAANNAGVPFKDVINNYTLPDGVKYSGSDKDSVAQIFWNNRGSDYPSTMANIAFNYWATDLRPDLYQGGTTKPKPGNIVSPYLPDSYTGLFGAATVTVPFQTGTNADGTPSYSMPAEKYFNPNNDPATWPHVVQYMVTLGVSGDLIHSSDYDCKTYSATSPNDACALRTGKKASDGGTGWPRLVNNSAEGIDDVWHATVNSRGDYFNAGNPQDLVDQLSSILSNIADRGAAAQPSAVNASVATVGTLSFNVGYNSDWSGVFQAVTLNSDGTTDPTANWDAAVTLSATAASGRTIYTDTYTSGGAFSGGLAFTAANAGSLDATESSTGVGLQAPALSGGSDTVANRIDYLRGDATHEADGTYRSRTDAKGVRDVLGAIINSQPVYVSYPSGDYYDTWPAGSPEAAATSTNDYDAFVAANGTRPGTVYVGANDGMLHAFAAPAPTCSPGTPPTCTYGDGGTERWAFVPRAVYANLGNLTSVSNFSFRPTVDATPVTRDVFFSGGGADEWRTILASGVGLGGRGVFALDITDPTAFSATSVLWEFDSDMTIPNSCVAVTGTTPGGTCKASDLGYTVSQPNIGRIKYNNEWVVLVPNGYFPDCSQPDIPTANKTACSAIAAQAPTDGSGNPYSALFVLDAQSGNVIAELKTPTGIPLMDGSGNVISFGLATPVMGDYDNDQIDDVAFAGDLEGNLWKFDLRGASPSAWTVTLVYQGNDDGSGNQGLQQITTMPRLFPDPVTNSFMVVFGTGKYLGAGDNGPDATQAMMGVRDDGTTYQQSDLTHQYLHEMTAPATLPNGNPNPNAGATLRCVTGKSTDTCDTTSTTNPPSPVNDSSGSGGWVIDLYIAASATDPTSVDQGERVVVSPGAIFASNTVVFETLLTGTAGSDPCNPSTQGALMALNAITGAPAGVSSLGGWPIVGGRISNARTSGSLPLVSALGGGQAYLPGTMLAPSGKTPLSIDAPIWRRRSWSEINQNQ